MTQVKTTAAEVDANEARYLEAARDAFPHWDFLETFGGWEAVPAGTAVVRAETLDAVVMKLRKRAEHGVRPEAEEDRA